MSTLKLLSSPRRRETALVSLIYGRGFDPDLRFETKRISYYIYAL